jgi:hypothetical protein
MNNHYVYVYIDPRNHEEFYYGMGKGNRKEDHLNESGESEKVRIIKQIIGEGLKPIIKVIAKGLTEEQAQLVEKTLIWKLGKYTTNIATGHYAENFRPHNQLHKNLSSFDYENGVYYVNVGIDIDHIRNWSDCVKYGFLSAGQELKYSKPLKRLKKGDIVAAYISDSGYVGIGVVTKTAIRVNDFRFQDKPLSQLPLKETNIFLKSDNECSEYLVGINWENTLEQKDAKKYSGIFTNPNIVASLDNQVETKQFLEKEFNVDFNSILRGLTK